jgi:hypothetical protein
MATALANPAHADLADELAARHAGRRRRVHAPHLTQVDPAIRSAVVAKLQKARPFAEDVREEEARMHKLVCSWHGHVKMHPWELALQYERVMEKHIDLITSQKLRERKAGSTTREMAKRVLKRYQRYITFGISSPSVPCDCKEVLEKVRDLLQNESDGLTMIGVRRIEHSLKLLKVKIDQRCEELQRTGSKRKSTGTQKTPESSSQSSITAQHPTTPPKRRRLAPLLPLIVHSETPSSSTTAVHDSSSNTATPTAQTGGSVSSQAPQYLPLVHTAHLQTSLLNTSPSQRLVKDSRIASFAPAAVRNVFQMKP